MGKGAAPILIKILPPQNTNSLYIDLVQLRIWLALLQGHENTFSTIPVLGEVAIECFVILRHPHCKLGTCLI